MKPLCSSIAWDWYLSSIRAPWSLLGFADAASILLLCWKFGIFFKPLLESYSGGDQWSLGCKVAESWFFPLRIVVLFEDSWQVVDVFLFLNLSGSLHAIRMSWRLGFANAASSTFLLEVQNLFQASSTKLFCWWSMTFGLPQSCRELMFPLPQNNWIFEDFCLGIIQIFLLCMNLSGSNAAKSCAPFCCSLLNSQLFDSKTDSWGAVEVFFLCLNLSGI